jgi:NTE family protein
LALFPAFAGISFERGNVWSERHDIAFNDAVTGASLWTGISTPIGPVYAGVGRTDDGRSALYLALGTAF